jgi:hypothetical protein
MSFTTIKVHNVMVPGDIHLAEVRDPYLPTRYLLHIGQVVVDIPNLDALVTIARTIEQLAANEIARYEMGDALPPDAYASKEKDT